MRWSKYFFLMVVLLVSITVRGQYNPTNPAEPGVTYTLTLKSTPSAGGSFNINAVTNYTPGTSVRLRAYNNNHYTFKCWEEKGEVISTAQEFDYVMPSRASTLTAHFEYNPSNPAEPTVPNIPKYRPVYLSVSPANSGSFNINSGNKYEVGTSVSLRASNNSNFVFKNWTEDGEIISTSSSFNYVVKDKDARLVANFEYAPNNPAEPSTARLSHVLGLKCNPSGGGYFNVSSGNTYQEGTSVSLYAYSNQYYTFKNWSIGDSIISTSYHFSYVMPTHDITLTANYSYNYTPDNPGEPGGVDAHTALYGMTESVIRGQNVLYPIFLENTAMQAKGFVVDVKFPEGFEVSQDAIAISGRGTDHELTVTDLEENNYRLSVSGTEPLSDSNGKVLDIPVKVPTDAEMGKTYPVELTHGVIVGTDDTQTAVSVRSGGLLVERISEEGLYSRFSFDKYQNRVKFTNLSSDKAVRYEWDFGDGTQSTEVSPMHIYEQSGIYTVTLTAYGEVGNDVAEMSVLINDESTWKAQGTYYLTSETSGVRYFTSLDDLFNMLKGSTISGNVRIAVESGQSFEYELTETNLATISDIGNALTSGNFTLSFEKSGTDRNPLVQFGKDMTSYDSSVATTLFEMSKQMDLQEVEFHLWGILINLTQLNLEKYQCVRSGDMTAAADFSLISPDLTYTWNVTSEPSTELSGYEQSGEGVIPSMSIVNDSDVAHTLSYHVSGSYQGVEIHSFEYEIEITPVLIGSFHSFSPAEGEVIPTTTLTLTWNKIQHATYDVYIWNTNNERPSTPIVVNLTDTCYTVSRYCQYGNSYQWCIKAKNAYQEIESKTMEFRIDKRKLTDDVYSVVLPANDITYDGHIHEAEITFHVEGVGEAKFIYTNHGEDEPLPAAPMNVGVYDIYLEITDGTLYYGKDRTYLSTFAIYQFDESEWLSLQTLCEELIQFGWSNPWDVSQGVTSVGAFQGLLVEQGHVVEFELNGQNLSGLFPMTLLAFPYLRSINLSGNHLTGDLSMTLSEIVSQNPSLTAHITSLNISQNQYEGNVGVLANCFPNLTSLDCSYNCFEDVNPMISPNVTELNLGAQTMNRVVELDMANTTMEELVGKIPSILLYNHAQQTFSNDINLMLESSDKENNPDWAMQIAYVDGQFSIPYVSSQNAYYGDSGDTLSTKVLNPQNGFEGNTFRIKLLFEQGDANFIDGVNASDLQATILYAFGKYKGSPFNYTAANTYIDNIINVQDVVCLVNLLLEETIEPMYVPMSRIQATQDVNQGTDASIYIRDGKIILYTNTPIAAMSIQAEGDIYWDLEQYGMTQSIKDSHLVGYSLSGRTLPTGETVIGTCAPNADIKRVSLADSAAKALSVSVGEDTSTSIPTIGETQECQIFDLSGRKQNGLKKGINLIYKDGKVTKVINK